MRRTSSMISNKDILALSDSHPRHPKVRRTPRARQQQLFAGAIFVCTVLVLLALKSRSLLYGAPCARDTFAEIAAADTNRNPAYKSLRNLIVVAGHAIYTGRSYGRADVADEAHWILEPFQKGQVATFLRHIQHGVDLMTNDTESLLVFSGGQTRPMAGPRSEALSYYLVANLSSNDNSNINRVSTEEYARDSHENLLFSLCRFRQLTGRYPLKVTVVSFGFKRNRFENMHRRAIRWPSNHWNFSGINPDNVDPKALQGETLNSFGPFLDDPYGCIDKGLRQKRIDRNPFVRFMPYPQGCPELASLFRYCGHSFFKGKLPWDNL